MLPEKLLHIRRVTMRIDDDHARAGEQTFEMMTSLLMKSRGVARAIQRIPQYVSSQSQDPRRCT
jgi:hypothetical protein